MSAKLIMFDGPDGVGKTTQITLAAQALAAKGLDVLVTRINGGSPIGEALREVYLSALERPAGTDFYLGMAIYEAFVVEIEHRRQLHDIILVDRSPFSNVAYQSFGSGYPLDASLKACQETLAKLRPDLIVCYTAPLTTLRARLGHAIGTKTDYFESKPDSFFDKVIEGYAYCAQQFEATVVDATGDTPHIHDITMQAVEPVLG